MRSCTPLLVVLTLATFCKGSSGLQEVKNASQAMIFWDDGAWTNLRAGATPVRFGPDSLVYEFNNLVTTFHADPLTYSQADVMARVRVARPESWAADLSNFSRVRAYLVKDAVVVLAFVIAALLYSQTHDLVARVVGLKLSHVCCLSYASLSVAIDLSIKNAAEAYGGSFPFHPACAVIVVEGLKFAVSACLLAWEARLAGRAGATWVHPRLSDVGWMAIPATIYAMNNLLVFQAIRATPISTFGVVRETMLFWNVMLWSLAFQRRVSCVRWIAIGGIFLGCTLNQASVALEAEFSWGVLWACLLAFTTALGAVANEFAMKQRAELDINLQNCILYSMCGSITLATLAVSDTKRVASFGAFFAGFVPECWLVIILQVITGLAISRILKYVEAVTKTIVAALRGPGVIFIGCLAFQTRLSFTEICATLLVCSSCFVYLRQGPLVATSPTVLKSTVSDDEKKRLPSYVRRGLGPSHSSCLCASS
eukprot:CAMPEP_0117557246 /NCGR_PEP_ID=MMETSP0784-20121206/52227_1 /TAXON_ID=39447 /ORGANISM="" /LENGTH=481 /DNA_ID=CAMNT_0005354549 /DNA_START=35 /DNA_END=1478 /DNA_ORIENTATION=-